MLCCVTVSSCFEPLRSVFAQFPGPSTRDSDFHCAFLCHCELSHWNDISELSWSFRFGNHFIFSTKAEFIQRLTFAVISRTMRSLIYWSIAMIYIVKFIFFISFIKGLCYLFINHIQKFLNNFFYIFKFFNEYLSKFYAIMMFFHSQKTIPLIKIHFFLQSINYHKINFRIQI